MTRPAQLPPLYPPYRFAAVEDDLYRGGFPKDRNLRFLARLRLRTILSLTPDPPSDPALLAFAAAHAITLIHIRVDKPKEAVIPLSFPRVVQILQVLLDVANTAPLYMHCLDGSLVTSVVVCCLRKLQCWS
ncbi:protein-tyrosine phosphatase, partial [Entophlyctis helioformis]